MKIGILGLGFVGGTHLRAFERAGMSDMLVTHDIKDTNSSLKPLLSSDVIFMCLPSPTREMKQDLSAIQSACAELHDKNYLGVVCLKSTVLPGTTTALENKHGLRICHSPEFLRERTALQDFEAQETCLISGHAAERRIVMKAYQEHRRRANLPLLKFIEAFDPVVTELAKYLHNTFLATKVAFANEFSALCERHKASYDTVVQAACSQGAVGLNHWQVPGPDGRKGYGGSCFPKDVVALLSQTPELSILMAAHLANENVRAHDTNCMPLPYVI